MQVEKWIEGFDTELSGPESHESVKNRESYGLFYGGLKEMDGNGGVFFG